MDESRQPLLHRMRKKAVAYHEQIPYLRRLPGSAIAIILFLVLVNLLVWIACAIVLHFHTSLVSTAVLAYTLGLRHALDADHIAAIDLCTRRLVASGQRPVTVGTFFSLGHSTIVIVTAIVVAASSAAISDRFDSFSDIGGIIGSSVSSAFLIILGTMNGYILYKLVTALREAIRSPIGHEQVDSGKLFVGGGCMTALLQRLFRLIDRPWKMYPLGVLFGLGFDTSSEVALLGISSIQAAKGTSMWLILIFPILFTAGMCLLDTTDGAAMMSLYSSARLASDSIAVLYYQSVLTAITVAVALAIGTLQLLTMILSIHPELDGPFWHGVEVAGDKYDIIGGSICGAFVVFGGLAFVCYRPWRRRVDRWRMIHAPVVEGQGFADEGSEELGSREASAVSPVDRKGGASVQVRVVEDGNYGTASRS
jgi:high-affinity nickel-transport protein